MGSDRMVFVAAPTPFLASGAFDPDAFRHNIGQWIEAGVDGILVLGTTGEAVHMDDAESDALIAVARAAAWAKKLVIMDEPTAALGVRESGQVLELIRRVRDNGLPVILISHNMPHVFEVADRIHIHRLGRRAAVVSPQTHTMHEVVGIMTGAVVHDIEHPDKKNGTQATKPA